jgi:hypothetical protein
LPHTRQHPIGQRDDRKHHLLEALAPQCGILPGSRCRRRTTRVVDQDIDRPEGRLDGGDTRIHRHPVRQIERGRHRVAAGLLDFRDDTIESCSVDIGKCDTRALARQRHGNRAAEAAAGAEHQRDLAFKSEIHGLSFVDGKLAGER